MTPKEIRTWQRRELMGPLQLFNSIFGRIRKYSTAGYTNVKTQYVACVVVNLPLILLLFVPKLIILEYN